MHDQSRVLLGELRLEATAGIGQRGEVRTDQNSLILEVAAQVDSERVLEFLRSGHAVGASVLGLFRGADLLSGRASGGKDCAQGSSFTGAWRIDALVHLLVPEQSATELVLGGQAGEPAGVLAVGILLL